MEARPTKRRRYESLGPVDISWPLGVEPSYGDELQLRHCLVLSRYETGRGTELPKHRQIEIEREASNLGLSIPQVLHLRHLYMKQLVRGGDLADDCDTPENTQLLRDATEQFLRWQCQLHILSRCDLELLGQTDTPDIVIPDGGCIINGREVYWVDCIASYGAASLAKDPNLYISTLRVRAESHCATYGPGAFVFLFGNSRDLLHTLGLCPTKVQCLGAQPLNTKELLERCFPSEEGLCREEIDCPSDRAGLVIGPGGHTIREIMTNSGCDIVLHRTEAAASSQTTKIVITSFSMDPIRMAIDLIGRVIESAEQFCRRVLCPLTKVGVVVGKQGTTVREIMRQCNCSIKTHKDDLSSDGKYQVFVACGPTEDHVLHAEALINAVIKSGKAVLERTAEGRDI